MTNIQRKDLEDIKEALEKSTFHHPVCGWYDGNKCGCTHKNVANVLSKVNDILEDNNEKN